MNKMGIAVITIYCNESFRIKNWLEYYYDYKDEIDIHIIVDNNSSLTEFQELKKAFPDSVIIRLDRNGGVTAAYNAGIKYVLDNPAIDAVAFIGNDIKIEKNGIKRLYDFLFSNEKFGEVSPVLLKKDSNIIDDNGDWFNYNLIMKIFDYNKNFDDTILPHISDGLPGAMNIAKKKMYDNIGLLNETLFMYSDEVDIGIRAKKAGYVFSSYPSVKAWHQHINFGNAPKRPPFTNYLVTRNKVYLAGLYYGMLRKICVFTYFSTTSIMHMFYKLLKKDLVAVKKDKWQILGACNGLINNMKHNKYSNPGGSIIEGRKSIIGLFPPPEIKYSSNDIDYYELKQKLGKSFSYASRGRHAIYHILKSLEVKGKCIIPIYSCPTIAQAVKKAGLEVCYCDINVEDLNLSFESFVECHKRNEATCVIVPSLYGNPADLLKFEAYCKQNKIIMIDDGAQSFGAKLDNRYISTFGDGGLFAFSPGKSTPAPMGALFWSANKEYKIPYTKRHKLIHKIIYENYQINRVKSYKYNNLYNKIIKYFSIYAEKYNDIKNDGIFSFEKEYLGSVLKSFFNGNYNYRNEYFDTFYNRFCKQKAFRILKAQQGISINHKIVLILDTIEKTNGLTEYLNKSGIKTYGGYKKPCDLTMFKKANSVIGKIIELPIVENTEKMNYMMDLIDKYYN